jgi:G2/mitotic-specific cyclin 1/2
LVTNNKGKSKAASGKEKEKEASGVKEKFDGVMIKTKATTTTTTLRQTARAIGGTSRRVARTIVTTQPEVLEEVVEVPDDDAMAVDDQPATFARRISTRSVGSSRRVQAQGQDDDAEATRVFKKRRTSSEAPVSEGEMFEQELRQNSDAGAADLEAFANAEPEADPEGDEWDDLDAEDADDPLMVSEYVVEIFKYMKEIEVRCSSSPYALFSNSAFQQTTMPNPLYMDSQKELAWTMRGILTDWLVQVHVRFRLMPETLFLCINIIDRFLSARVVSLAKLQLVGITCLFIASKVEEIVSPSVSHFLYCADSSYTENEILQAERYVLKTLDWNLSYPNPIHFLRRVSKADEYDVKARTIAKYLLEIGCLEWRLLSAAPSLMAAAAIWLARLILDHETWVR